MDQDDKEDTATYLVVVNHEEQYSIWREGRPIPKGWREAGKSGPPLLAVDYRSGEGSVLTSEDSNWVGARIEGLVHLDMPGRYEFAFESNDGVRLEINGDLVVEDPRVHADQLSQIGTVTVIEAGWYPLVIWYFEKENTSTLRWLWRKPGTNSGEGLTVVPGVAIAHVPDA